MGSGGDEAVDQAQLLPDLLRHGQIRQWSTAVAAEASWYGPQRRSTSNRACIWPFLTESGHHFELSGTGYSDRGQAS